MTGRHYNIVRPAALPPIGFCAPPASANWRAPLWVFAGVMLAGVTAWAVIGPYAAGVPLPVAGITSDLFPKDPARVTDANGNPMEARR